MLAAASASRVLQVLQGAPGAPGCSALAMQCNAKDLAMYNCNCFKVNGRVEALPVPAGLNGPVLLRASS